MTFIHEATIRATEAPELDTTFVPPEGVLVLLGFGMVVVFMALIMTKRLTPMVALILVPTIFGLFAGAGFGLGEMVLKAIGNMAPTAALLMFAIMFFGIMIDVGLFDPLISFITRILGNDPLKIVLGTGLLAAAVSLDGDGSTTFIITTSAMLPIYLRLGMSPVVLTCVAGLMNGIMNILPWGGPTVRAATALNLQVSDVFVPMIPAMLAGIIIAFGFAWILGLQERNRLRQLENGYFAGFAGEGRTSGIPKMFRGADSKPGARASLATGNIVTISGAHAPVKAGAVDPADTSMADTMLDPNRATLRPKLVWWNLLLTTAVLVALVMDIMPLPFIFMVGSAIALVLNFGKMKDQAAEIVAHAPSIVGVVSMVLAAGVLVGVLTGTGMVEAMANWITTMLPDQVGPFLAPITGLLSIPFTFFMSNDAFYYGILPVLSQSAAAYGIEPVEMARASIIGQPVHMQSPLVPAILLLVSLAGVNLGDHHKKVLWRATIISLVMLAVGVLLGAIPLVST